LGFTFSCNYINIVYNIIYNYKTVGQKSSREGGGQNKTLKVQYLKVCWLARVDFRICTRLWLILSVGAILFSRMISILLHVLVLFD